MLTDNCSRLLQGSDLGLLLEEEEDGLDATTGSDGLCLDVLNLLDDGFKPSTEGRSLNVVRHSDRTGQRTDDGGIVSWIELVKAKKTQL
jgi:hypothetical protein